MYIHLIIDHGDDGCCEDADDDAEASQLACSVRWKLSGGKLRLYNQSYNVGRRRKLRAARRAVVIDVFDPLTAREEGGHLYVTRCQLQDGTEDWGAGGRGVCARVQRGCEKQDGEGAAGVMRPGGEHAQHNKVMRARRGARPSSALLLGPRLAAAPAAALPNTHAHSL